jgi:uncharacterized protein (DUF58 family)
MKFRPFLRGASEAEARRSLASADALARVRRLEIRTRGLVDSLFSGEHGSIFHGRGLEFSHVRGYQPGDDVRSIDWKVTARRGTPYVRQFVEERDLLVVLMVDISASGRFGPGDRSAGEVAAEIAAALTFAATRNNDRVSLLLVSDQVEHFVVPTSGRNHAIRLLADLVSHRPAATATDLVSGFDQIERRIRGRAALFVISDFIQDHRSARYREALGRIARAHDLVAVRLASSATAELPNVGWVEIVDPESGRRVTVDTGSRGVRKRYRNAMLRAGAEIASLLGDVGAEFVDVDTAADPLIPLAQFFRRRRPGFR